MDEDESIVHAVQLNPAILNNVRQRIYDSIELVLIDCMYTFFSKMFLKATEDSVGHPELNPLNVFIDRLDMIPLWGENIVESTTDALREHAEKKYKFFELKKFLKKILSTQLCQAAALENRACSSKIQLNDVHVQEFLYNLLKLSAPHVSNAPQLFTPKRGAEYVLREEGLDMFLCRSIKRALSQFVELFLWRISAGEIDSPFVAIPEAVVQGPKEEAVPFKEIGEEGEDIAGRVEEDNSNPFEIGEGNQGEEEENEEEKEDIGGVDKEEDNPFSGAVNDDNRPWDINEGPRGRYNENDDLDDDYRRNPRKLSFNEDVEVQEFKKDAPVSILKRNQPSRIYKTKYDENA